MDNLIEIDYDEDYGTFFSSFSPYYLKLNGYWFSKEELMEIKNKIDILLEK